MLSNKNINMGGVMTETDTSFSEIGWWNDGFYMNIILVEIYGGEALRKFVLRKLNSGYAKQTESISGSKKGA